jgi:hypothetical protein
VHSLVSLLLTLATVSSMERALHGSLAVRLPSGCRAPVGQQLLSNEELCDATGHNDKGGYSGNDREPYH